MTIYIDVDGTLTQKQRKRSLHLPRHDVIEAAHVAIARGHTVILWTSIARHARDAARMFGINAAACLAKPDIIVDNEQRRWGDRLKRRTITPEQFLKVEL